MNKLLLAAALVVAFSLPGLAAEAKTQVRPKYRYLGSTAEHQLKSEKARKKSDRGEVNDPYWMPCDYTRNWGPNPCGGQ